MDGAAQYKARIMRIAKFLFWASLFIGLAYLMGPLVVEVLVFMAKGLMWIIATIIALIIVALVTIWIAVMYAELRKPPEK